MVGYINTKVPIAGVLYTVSLPTLCVRSVARRRGMGELKAL